MNTNFTYERYQRQIILKELGIAGQQKLGAAKVLVIGAGGLGCPALQYLAAAGIGTICIVDDDVVSLSNLHRQVLYTVQDIGKPKSIKAKEKLQQLNPEISIIAYNERLTTKNALTIIDGFDIIIDGTDNFASRYLINDACVLMNKPLVFGAVSQFEGQLAIFNYQGNDESTPVNYRDLFPVPPKDDEVVNCAEAGVLGVLPGIIGSMMANETIKLITGMGKPLIDSLLTFNALNNQVFEVALSSNPATALLLPQDVEAFKEMDYVFLCSASLLSFEIDVDSFNDLLATSKVDIIDVREMGEIPVITEFNYTQIPLSIFEESIPVIENETVILFCQSGKRSTQAAQSLIYRMGTSKKIFSLKGGIINWLNHYQNQQR